jgi:hypothetical protein
MWAKSLKKATHKNIDEINPRLPLGRVGFYHLSIDNIREHQTEFIPQTSSLKLPTISKILPSTSIKTSQPAHRVTSYKDRWKDWPSKKEKAYYSNFVYTKIVKNSNYLDI